MSSTIIAQGDPLADLRALRKQKDRGLLTDAEYLRLFHEIDTQTDQPCVNHSDRPAIMKANKTTYYCEECYRKAWPEIRARLRAQQLVLGGLP